MIGVGLWVVGLGFGGFLCVCVCVCVLLGVLLAGVMGLPLCLSSHRSRFCDCLLSSRRSGFCDCDGGCFVIWKRKVVVGPFFFSFSCGGFWLPQWRLMLVMLWRRWL